MAPASIMAYPPREHVVGRIYHMMTRGNGGRPIINAPEDWQSLWDLIAKVKRTSDFKLYAVCLMTNHFHLLLEAGLVTISTIMQRLKSSWARRLNFKQGTRGHVFEGRFKALDCDDDAYFKWLLRYIHMNPVKAGIVARPEDWEWSSYRQYMGSETRTLADIEWPLSLFASERHTAVDNFREFTMQGIDDDREPLPMFDSRVPTPPVERPTSEAETRPTIEVIAGGMADSTISLAEILSGSRVRAVSAARRQFVVRAAVSGYRPSELAAILNLSPAAISKMLS